MNIEVRAKAAVFNYSKIDVDFIERNHFSILNNYY